MTRGGRLAPVPIIVCHPRSGSTLLRLIFDSHPQLAMTPETHLNALFIGAAEQPAAADPRRTVFDALLGSQRWSDFHLSADVLWQELARLDPGCSVGDALRTFYRMYASQQGKSRYGDKNPGYVRLMPAVAEVLPESHFIHIVRDGRDVASSMRSLWFGPGDDIAAIAKDWVGALTCARQAAENLVGRYTEVHYEQLVSDPEPTLRRLAAILDLEFDGAMLQHHARAAARLSDLGELRKADGGLFATREAHQAIHRRAREPINTGRIGVWHTNLSTDETAIFEAIAGDMLVRFGYALSAQAARAKSLEAGNGEML